MILPQVESKHTQSDSIQKPGNGRSVAERALCSIVEGLHAAVVAEFVRCLTDRDNTALAIAIENLHTGQNSDLRTTERLWNARNNRWFGDRHINDRGVLFDGNISNTHQSLLEFRTLYQFNEAYQRVLANVTLSEVADDKNSAFMEIGADPGEVAALGKDWLKWLTFKANHKVSRERAKRRHVWMTLGVESLMKEIGSIIANLKLAGLYPIFVFDELDKLNDSLKHDGKDANELPGNRMGASEIWCTKLTDHLKNFLKDHAIFCFAADRRLYHRFYEVFQKEVYSPVYSSFQVAPYATIHPAEFVRVARQTLTLQNDSARTNAKSDATDGNTANAAESSADNSAATLWAHIMAFRSRCHPLEFSRLVPVIVGKKLRSPMHDEWRELWIWCSILHCLEKANKEEGIDAITTPYKFRLLLDALFYLPRCRDAGREVVALDAAFDEYLKKRIVSDGTFDFHRRYQDPSGSVARGRLAFDQRWNHEIQQFKKITRWQLDWITGDNKQYAAHDNPAMPSNNDESELAKMLQAWETREQLPTTKAQEQSCKSQRGNSDSKIQSTPKDPPESPQSLFIEILEGKRLLRKIGDAWVIQFAQTGDTALGSFHHTLDEVEEACKQHGFGDCFSKDLKSWLTMTRVNLTDQYAVELDTIRQKLQSRTAWELWKQFSEYKPAPASEQHDRSDR